MVAVDEQGFHTLTGKIIDVIRENIEPDIRNLFNIFNRRIQIGIFLQVTCNQNAVHALVLKEQKCLFKSLVLLVAPGDTADMNITENSDSQ